MRRVKYEEIRFSGTIVFAEGFGISGNSTVKTAGETQSVIFTAFETEGDSFTGVTAIKAEGQISPAAAAGVIDLEVITLNETQTIPIWRAMEVADAPAVDLALADGRVEATLENGFSLFRVTGANDGIVTAGTIIRVEALGAEFPVKMTLSMPGDDDNNPILISNTDENLDATSNTIELLAPRSGSYFLSIDHEESTQGAEFTFTAAATQVQMQNANNQDTEVVLERPGHGAWFARNIAAGQYFRWAINPTQGSDAVPAVYFMRNYTNEDGEDIFGEGVRVYQAPLSGLYLNYLGRYNGGRGMEWPGTWEESLLIWRVVDVELGGGQAYGLTFNGGVN